MDIRIIAAVGNRGQIGLDGKMPWRNSLDLQFFAEQTAEGICIYGKNTEESLSHLRSPEANLMDDRFMVTHPTKGQRFFFRDDPSKTPGEFITYIANECGLGEARTFWIIGGAKTYRRYMPIVSRYQFTRIDYDGPADVWMPEFSPNYALDLQKRVAELQNANTAYYLRMQDMQKQRANEGIPTIETLMIETDSSIIPRYGNVEKGL